MRVLADTGTSALYALHMLTSGCNQIGDLIKVLQRAEKLITGV